jgi:type I restriction enzyme M protein
MALERTIERNVDIFLSANGWEIDNPSKKNVFYQSALPEQYAKRLEGTRPDYTLFYEDKPIGIIEVKKPGSDLNKAMAQALGYAKKLNAPLVFATDGSFCKSQWFPDGKTLILNNEEVSELLPFSDAVKFIKDNSSSVFTIDEKVIKSRAELITIFASLNDVLRSDGIRAGMDRFSEFANILFLKLISDQSNLDYWERIKNQNDADLIDYINKTLFDKITLKYGGNVFEPLLINNVKTLREIIRRIDHLSLVSIDTDIKGGAFEYFIEKTTTTQNDLGEYYTPRHIVKSMMSLVKPKMGEKIYDPFCGTGGFLTGAFQHILKHVKCAPGSEEEKKLKKETLYGGEITTNARIAKMNMILYGDGHSGVTQIDSLANPVKELYDLVVTNIPFSQKVTKDISNLYNNGLAKNNGDAACLLHCFESLKPGGRMAVVVPEGVLFRNDLKKIRQYLCENSKLHSIISLPQGVFLPYTGVKTSILYFTNKGEKTLKYWYFKVNNDGFSLNVKRKKIKGTNDLHVLDSCVDRLKEGDLIEGFHQVDLNKNTYSFHFVKEKEEVNSDWPMVELEQVCKLKNGFAFKSNDYVEKSNVLVCRIGNIKPNDVFDIFYQPIYLPNDYADKYNEYILHDDDIVVAMTDCRNDPKTLGIPTFVKTLGNQILLNQRVGKLEIDQKLIFSKYLKYILGKKSIKQRYQEISNGSVQINLSKKDFLSVKIPLPSLKQQQEIVKELESYHKIIEGAKLIRDSWKPYFKIDDRWEIKTLSEVCEVQPKKPNLNDQLHVSFINMESMPIDGYKFSHNNIKKVFEVSKSYTYFEENDILLAKITPCFENGKCGIVTNLKNNIGFGSTEFIVLRCNNECLPEYIYNIISNSIFRKNGKKHMHGSVGHQRIPIDFVKNYPIYLPPLSVQQEIVERLEKERAFVDYQDNIIKCFEAKIEEKLESLWRKV